MASDDALPGATRFGLKAIVWAIALAVIGSSFLFNDNIGEMVWRLAPKSVEQKELQALIGSKDTTRFPVRKLVRGWVTKPGRADSSSNLNSLVCNAPRYHCWLLEKTTLSILRNNNAEERRNDNRLQ